MANVATLSARAAFDVSDFVAGSNRMKESLERSQNAVKDYSSKLDALASEIRGKTVTSLEKVQERVVMLKHAFAMGKLSQVEFSRGMKLLEGELKNATTSAMVASHKINQLEQSNVKAAGSFRGMVAGAATMGVAFSAMNSVINAVSSGIGRFIGGVKWGLELQIQAENASVGFEVMLGSSKRAKKMMEDIQDFAIRTPFDTQSVTDNVTLLSGMGIAADELLPALKTLGDLSLGNSERLMGLALAFGQVQAKGKLMAQEFNQFAERGVNLRESLAKNLGVEISQVAKQMEDGKISAEIFRNSLIDLAESKFGGMMEKRTETLGGKIDKIREKVGLIFKDIAAGLFSDDSGFNKFEQFLDDFRSKHVPAIVAALKGIGEQIVQYSKIAGDALGLNDKPVRPGDSGRVSIANAANVFGMQNENIAKQQARLDYIRKLKEQGASEEVVAQFIDLTRGAGGLNKALQDIGRNKGGLEGLKKIEPGKAPVNDLFNSITSSITANSTLFFNDIMRSMRMNAVNPGGAVGMLTRDIFGSGGAGAKAAPVQTTGALKAGSSEAFSQMIRSMLGNAKASREEKSLATLTTISKGINKLVEAVTKGDKTLITIPDLGLGFGG